METIIPGWPLYFKDRLYVGNLNSSVGIATCWLPKEVIVSELSSDSFSVCGQLYTKRGINPLVRNLLSNTRIRFLVVCGVDRQGSGEALLNLFEKGLEKRLGNDGNLESYYIKDDPESRLDKEISEESILKLIRSIEVLDMRGKSVSEIKKVVQELPTKEPYSSAEIFPEPKSDLKDAYPTDLAVFKVRRDKISEAWLDVLKIVLRFGIDTVGMYGVVKQVNNLCVVVENEDTKSPSLPDYLGFNDQSLFKYYEGFFNKNEDNLESYTYGERIYDWGGNINQYEEIVKKLKRYKYDRGAIIVLWEVNRDNFPPTGQEIKEKGQTKGWKVPCLVMISAQYLNDKLFLTAVFRNNDMFGAWVLNAFALRRFQETLCKELEIEPGPLITISQIAEIYEYDWDGAEKIVSANDSTSRTCIYDPRSYYTVKVDGKDILCEFFSPDGLRQLASFRVDGTKPKAARDLCALAIKDMLLSDLGSAADLGRQLAKAESAIKLGLVFEQDRPLSFSKAGKK